MKGVILAGGLGKRLEPLTRITNKHLLPIYNKPMVYYPLQTLVDAGLKEIMIVTGGNNAGDFLRLLGNGSEFGLKHIDYTYQKGEGGIAAALSLAEHFAEGDKIVVILGDNLVEKSIKKYVEHFAKQPVGARILVKKVEDPERFGVVEFSAKGEISPQSGGKGKKIVSIEEKPKKPKSDYAVTGIYMFDNQVFDFIKTLKPSWRNELEITDVLNKYLQQGGLSYDILDGWWTDCGLYETLYRATHLVREKLVKENKIEPLD